MVGFSGNNSMVQSKQTIMNKYLLTEEQLLERDRQVKELCAEHATAFIRNGYRDNEKEAIVNDDSILNAPSPPLPEAIQPEIKRLDSPEPLSEEKMSDFLNSKGEDDYGLYEADADNDVKIIYETYKTMIDCPLKQHLDKWFSYSTAIQPQSEGEKILKCIHCGVTSGFDVYTESFKNDDNDDFEDLKEVQVIVCKTCGDNFRFSEVPLSSLLPKTIIDQASNPDVDSVASHSVYVQNNIELLRKRLESGNILYEQVHNYINPEKFGLEKAIEILTNLQKTTSNLHIVV